LGEVALDHIVELLGQPGRECGDCDETEPLLHGDALLLLLRLAGAHAAAEGGTRDAAGKVCGTHGRSVPRRPERLNTTPSVIHRIRPCRWRTRARRPGSLGAWTPL